MSEPPPSDGERLGRRPAERSSIEAPGTGDGWPRAAVLSVTALALIVLLLLVLVLT